MFKKLQKKNNRLLRSPLLFFVLIPSTLLFFWVALSIYLFARPFSVITEPYETNNLKNYKTTELLRGEKVIGQFRAKENNMGTVVVRFYNYGKISTDVVKFRIKQSSANNWYYENSYKVDQFQPNEYFTFGFPEIKQSKGINFSIEIESTKGVPGNAIGLSSQYPVLASRHQFSTIYFSKNKLFLLTFMVAKLKELFLNPKNLIDSSIYLVPFLLYVFLLIFVNVLKIKKRPMLTSQLDKSMSTSLSKFIDIVTFLYFLVIIFDIFSLHISNFTGLLILYLFWFLLINLYDSGFRISFTLALVFFGISVIIPVFTSETFTREIIKWMYLFLFVGIVQLLLDKDFLSKNEQT